MQILYLDHQDLLYKPLAELRKNLYQQLPAETLERWVDQQEMSTQFLSKDQRVEICFAGKNGLCSSYSLFP